jgi:hypothetical protein
MGVNGIGGREERGEGRGTIRFPLLESWVKLTMAAGSKLEILDELPITKIDQGICL